MRVKSLVDDHDTTLDKVYETTAPPSWAGSQEHGSVWVVDDVGEYYILFESEYELVLENVTDDQ
jgi:hypothetical protein